MVATGTVTNIIEDPSTPKQILKTYVLAIRLVVPLGGRMWWWVWLVHASFTFAIHASDRRVLHKGDGQGAGAATWLQP
jgi:hypothetical protein